MQSTTNFRPVFLKKVVSHFSRNLWPWISKKSQKISNFWKNFFSLETTLNALKFFRNTICAVHNKFQAGISQKRSWSFFKKSVTLDMQKKSKDLQFLKKFFFARNNLKCLKICSQHHLCSPQQISGRYFSKKKLVIFQEICDPGYAKKVKKFQVFEKIFFRSKRAKTPYNLFATPFVQSMKNFRPVFCKKVVSHFSRNLWPRICKKSQKIGNLGKFFFARNDLKHLKIRSQHHLCSPRQISGRYLSKKKLVIFQEICDPDMQKKSKNWLPSKNFFSLETT